MRRAALAAGGLAVAFTLLSALVATGSLRVFDRQVAVSFGAVYSPSLLTLFRAVALLGGLELTFLLAAGLFVFLWRQGYRLGAWAAAALPLSTLLEIADKRFIEQPSPPASMAHLDGPSITDFLQGSVPGWSFPSGHVTRAVVIYGLLAFVAGRLTTRPMVRRLAPVAAGVLLVALAFDRLYLAVHWESDVIGGLLLGATFLAAAISWLEWSAARAR